MAGAAAAVTAPLELLQPPQVGGALTLTAPALGSSQSSSPAGGADALCFVALLLTCFIPLQHLVRVAEDGEGWDWEYRRFPVWLLLAYALLCGAYAQCQLASGPLDSRLHALLSAAAYVAAAKHALRTAGEPPAARAALFCVVLCSAAAAGGHLYGEHASGCRGAFASCALLLGLSTLRLGRRWQGDPPYDPCAARARRRALATLAACAVVAACQPWSGGCGGGAGGDSPELQVLQDALVLAAATDFEL